MKFLIAAVLGCIVSSPTFVEARVGNKEKSALVAQIKHLMDSKHGAGDDLTGDMKGDFTMRDGLPELEGFPGSEYLGMGYDLIEGNPEGDPLLQMDPGFREPAVSVEWDADQPIGGYAVGEVSCYQNDEAVETSSASDYQQELEEQVDVEASVAGEAGIYAGEASFSASRGSESFKNDVAETTSSRFSVTSFCVQHKVAYSANTDWSAHKFVDRAEEDVKELKPIVGLAKDTNEICDELNANNLVASCSDPEVDYDSKCKTKCEVAKWMNFFTVYGTHFLSTVHLGGKRITEVVMDSETVTEIESTGVTAATAVAASASVDGGIASGEASGSVSGSSAASEALSLMQGSSSVKTSTKIFGGSPPEDSGAGGFAEWAATVPENPMPVRYSLVSNYKLMRGKGSFKQADFDEALLAYITHAQEKSKYRISQAKEILNLKQAARDKSAKELEGSRTVITSSTGDIAFEWACGWNTILSPNGKVKVVFLDTGRIQVDANNENIWDNGVGVKSKEFLYSLFHEQEVEWLSPSNMKGKKSKLLPTHVETISEECGGDTDWKSFFSINDDNQLTAKVQAGFKDTARFGKREDARAEALSWQMSCTGGKDKYFGKLVLGDNGNLEIFAKDGTSLWESGSTDGSQPKKAAKSSYGNGVCNL
jgi:hypothetical protein